MNTLYGRGNTALPVYARAAQVAIENGRPTLDPTLLVTAANYLRRGDGTLDVVLVVEDAGMGLWMPLPSSLNLVGVVAERELSGDPGTTLPIISGVTGALTMIQEGNLLILDPERDCVLVEPEAGEFVRLQEAHFLKRRVLLGGGHVPAHTQGGRVVEVWAGVRDFADVESALLKGADGILVDGSGDILPEEADTDPEAARARVLRLADAIGGGDVCIMAAFDAIDLMDMTVLAARSTLRWSWMPSALPVPLEAFQAELEAVADEVREEGERAAVPTLSAALFHLDEFPQENPPPFDEVLLTYAHSEELTPGAAFSLPPLRVLLSDDLSLLPEAVAAGAIGVIVTPALVEVAKDMIREQAY